MKKIIAIILLCVVILPIVTVFAEIIPYCPHEQNGYSCIAWGEWRPVGEYHIVNSGHYRDEERYGTCSLCSNLYQDTRTGDIIQHSYDKDLGEKRISCIYTNPHQHSCQLERTRQCVCGKTHKSYRGTVESHSWFLGFICFGCGATR